MLIPELQWTKAVAAEGEDQSALGHAHGVKVAAFAAAAAFPGEEDES